MTTNKVKFPSDEMYFTDFYYIILKKPFEVFIGGGGVIPHGLQ
jgi:hypothetical protein